MTNAEEAIIKVFTTGGELFIPCKDKVQQESIRVMAFNLRRKMPKEIQDMVGISKAEEEGGLYVKIYKREQTELLERDVETGKLVPIQDRYDPDVQRIVDLMKRDGKSEEEIKEHLKNQ